MDFLISLFIGVQIATDYLIIKYYIKHYDDDRH